MQKLLDQCTEVEQQLENNIAASGSGDGCKSKWRNNCWRRTETAAAAVIIQVFHGGIFG